MMFKVLIADDHKVLRECLRRILDEEPNLEIVAEAQDGCEAVMLAEEKKADIVLMDITMPKLNGIEAAREILKKMPFVKILILSMHSNKQFLEDAFKAGIYGYLLKNCAISEVITAIQTVLDGKYYISPDIAGVMIQDYVGQNDSKDKSPHPLLSKRELEVLRYVANGETTKKIADFLSISSKTVEVHRKSIMEKLGCHNLAELIKTSIQMGYVSIEKDS